jgi:DNA-binding MarR family transcriptional regulator
MRDHRVTGTELRVWLYLLSQASLRAELPVTQKSIGEALGIRLPQVSAALKSLTCYQIIAGRRDGARMLYSLNSTFAVKGSRDRTRSRRA